jgi:phenylpropionate dioxygenase-like ring-hydroxylating dioxygenase large terminal subunit
MFDLLPNVWTPAVPVSEIEDTPVAVELAGEKLVLFRNLRGEIGACLDRCPHRGAALSLGRVNESGCLECPYHGWQFDLNGTCVHVPFNNPDDVKLSQLSAVSLPTQISAGLVWIFTGRDHVSNPQLPESLMQSKESYFIHHEVWNAHWTRLIENAMDYVHLPFVHRNSFGSTIGQRAIEADSFAKFQVVKTEYIVQVFNHYHNIESGFAFEWHQPNLVVLKFDEMGIPVRVHSFAIPINQHQTRLLFAIQLLEPHAAGMVNEFIAPIVEDRMVIESQTGAIPLTTEEYNVPTDRATLLFRLWYHQTISRQAVLI